MKGVICMTKKEIFSKNLNSILETLQKTQIEVARAIGVSQQTFNMWCRGVAIPRMDKIQSLADYFHVPMASLIEDCNDISSSLSYSADEMAKAVDMYNEYIKASPEIQSMIETLLKMSQSMSAVPEVPHLKNIKGQRPSAEFPYLHGDNKK